MVYQYRIKGQVFSNRTVYTAEAKNGDGDWERISPYGSEHKSRNGALNDIGIHKKIHETPISIEYENISN